MAYQDGLCCRTVSCARESGLLPVWRIRPVLGADQRWQLRLDAGWSQRAARAGSAARLVQPAGLGRPRRWPSRLPGRTGTDTRTAATAPPVLVADRFLVRNAI